MKLSVFYLDNKEFDGACKPTNVDDIFRNLRREKIKEVEVNSSEMCSVLIFILGNLGNSEAEGRWRVELLKEYRVNKFMGIKLIEN